MYFILQSGGETNEAHSEQRISDNQNKKGIVSVGTGKPNGSQCVRCI